jgi:PST family polysaccharide transporter
MSREFKRIIKNFSSLLSLQGVNYLLPILILPFLVHKLGVETYGLFAFLTAITIFFRAIIDFGFDLTGTKDIVSAGIDQEKKNKIFSTIYILKLLLLIFCLILSIPLYFYIEQINKNMGVFLLFFLALFGDMLLPVWFFQGIEKMKFITIFKVTNKVLAAIFVLYFIESQSDLYLIPLIEGLASLLVGFLSILYIYKKFNIRYKKITNMELVSSFKENLPVFLSKFTVIFYTSFNIALLGVYGSNLIVGYYSIADKIYMAFRGLLNPAIQAVYPYFNRIYSSDVEKFNDFARFTSILAIIVLLFFAFIINTFGSNIVLLVTQEPSKEIEEILRILSLSLMFSVGTLFSAILVVKKKQAILLRITLITMVINIIIVIPSVIYFKEIGLAYTFVFVQFCHFVLQIFYNRELFLGKKHANS